MPKLPSTLLFFLAGLVVHAGNYLTQLLLGRSLGPESFSDFSAVFGIWLLLEVLTLSVQTITVSISSENKGAEGSNALIRAELARITRYGAPVLSILIVLASPWIARALKLTCGALPLVLVACCLPLSLNFAIERGVLQGQDRLGLLAKSLLCEVVARVFFTALVLLLGAGVTGAVLALFASVFVIHHYTVPPKDIPRMRPLSPRTRELLKTIALSTLALQLLNLTDLLAIKSVFRVLDAGYFAGFFQLGKIVLLISSPIYLLLLSRPVRARLAETNPLSELLTLTTCALILSSLVALVFTVRPELVLILLGEEYRPGLDALVPISWSAVSLVAITCCINYSIAMDYRRLAWLALLGGLGQPLVICLLPCTLVGACWMIFAYRTILMLILFLGILASFSKVLSY